MFVSVVESSFAGYRGCDKLMGCNECFVNFDISAFFWNVGSLEDGVVGFVEIGAFVMVVIDNFLLYVQIFHIWNIFDFPVFSFVASVSFRLVV